MADVTAGWSELFAAQQHTSQQQRGEMTELIKFQSDQIQLLSKRLLQRSDAKLARRTALMWRMSMVFSSVQRWHHKAVLDRAPLRRPSLDCVGMALLTCGCLMLRQIFARALTAQNSRAVQRWAASCRQQGRAGERRATTFSNLLTSLSLGRCRSALRVWTGACRLQWCYCGRRLHLGRWRGLYAQHKLRH